MAPSFFAGEAHDEVAHGDGADWRIGGEGVFFEVVVGEVRAEKRFGLGVAGAGGPARADGNEVVCVLVSATTVEVLGLRGERGKRGEKHNPGRSLPKQ